MGRCLVQPPLVCRLSVVFCRKDWLLQVFSGDASRLNLTPMVGALATAPLLRASQPLPRDFHTGMFKTASAMPRDTIQYAHKSKTLSTLAVESE